MVQFSKIGLVFSRNKGWYSQEKRLAFLKGGLVFSRNKAGILKKRIGILKENILQILK